MYPINCPKIEGDACEENRHTSVGFGRMQSSLVMRLVTGQTCIMQLFNMSSAVS